MPEYFFGNCPGKELGQIRFAFLADDNEVCISFLEKSQNFNLWNTFFFDKNLLSLEVSIVF